MGIRGIQLAPQSMSAVRSGAGRAARADLCRHLWSHNSFATTNSGVALAKGRRSCRCGANWIRLMGIQYCTKGWISPSPGRAGREFVPGLHPPDGVPAFGCDGRRPLVAPTGVGRASLEGRSEQHAPPDTSMRWPVIQPFPSAKRPRARISPRRDLALHYARAPSMQSRHRLRPLRASGHRSVTGAPSNRRRSSVEALPRRAPWAAQGRRESSHALKTSRSASNRRAGSPDARSHIDSLGRRALYWRRCARYQGPRQEEVRRHYRQQTQLASG